MATYSSPSFSSPSFFSNLTVDPSDRFLLSGGANGNAFIWDTFGAGDCVRLSVGMESEVAKTAWITDRLGRNQIACICDDVAFSLFNWSADEQERESGKGAQFVGQGRQIVDKSSAEPTPPTLPSAPKTPRKSDVLSSSIRSSPVNKSILEYFPPSPRLQ